MKRKRGKDGKFIKMGRYVKFICDFCGESFWDYRSNKPYKLKFCCRQHQNTWLARNRNGVKGKRLVKEKEYSALHKWIRSKLGEPKACEFCGKTDGRIELANKNHKYKEKLSDWISLCKKCHINYDKKFNGSKKGSGSVRDRYNEARER